MAAGFVLTSICSAGVAFCVFRFLGTFGKGAATTATQHWPGHCLRCLTERQAVCLTSLLYFLCTSLGPGKDEICAKKTSKSGSVFGAHFWYPFLGPPSSSYSWSHFRVPKKGPKNGTKFPQKADPKMCPKCVHSGSEDTHKGHALPQHILGQRLLNLWRHVAGSVLPLPAQRPHAPCGEPGLGVWTGWQNVIGTNYVKHNSHRNLSRTSKHAGLLRPLRQVATESQAASVPSFGYQI